MKAILLLAGICVASAASGAALQPADAAQNRDREAIQALVLQHANLNTPQPDGTTALQWAAHWNDVEMVNLLLKAGADPNVANRYGATPLSEAAALGNAAILEALLKAGADARGRTTA
ncbi:MAG TPA: ankyrin repeat domain-containing protein, partial [Bryobacteraceae bacterium]|nr:ankyrin repeat domain-containing protein [Bryobacteraceae bacterium]